MKIIKRFLLLVLCVLPSVAGAQVATTAGSNLTAWNGNSGATNNNNWNTMMNSRAGVSNGAPTADFGNCNSLILRCAQPKCSGCTSIEIARPIVEGCVNSNASCKQYADQGLIDYIAAQIVSNAMAKVQEQQLVAQQAAAAQAAAQSNMQIQEMQAQMSQMQQQMQQQSAQQMAQMQSALEEQKALAAAAQQDALEAQQARTEAASKLETVAGGEMTAVQAAAIQTGVSADMLARQQISGDIMTHVEDAEKKMKDLDVVMDNVFKYAGCDARGNNCKGPRRVEKFKELAQPFFDDYDAIVDELYEALELALVVGVDISDVIMMLNNACNKWGKYVCSVNENAKGYEKYLVYDKKTCPAGKSVKNSQGICDNDRKCYGDLVNGGQSCRVGMRVPPQDDARCTLLKILDAEGTEENTVQREWLLEKESDDGTERVGCATSALDNVAIFGRRRSSKGDSTVTLEVLERILMQDASEFGSTNLYTSGTEKADKTRVCAVTEKGYRNLENAINTKKVPGKVCVSDTDLMLELGRWGAVQKGGTNAISNSGIVQGIMNEDQCDRLKLYSDKECKVDFKGDKCRYDESCCAGDPSTGIKKDSSKTCANASGN